MRCPEDISVCAGNSMLCWINYCNVLYVVLPLKLQNAIAKLVSNVNMFDHISPVSAHLYWLPVLVLICKTIYSL